MLWLQLHYVMIRRKVKLIGIVHKCLSGVAPDRLGKDLVFEGQK